MKFRSSVFSVLAAVVMGLGAWGLGPSMLGGAMARASEDVDSILKLCTPATAEELKQILFVAELNGSAGLTYQVHNALRSRTIEGLVIRVEFMDPKASDQTVGLELFVRDHCPALQSSFGQQNFFRSADASRVPVTFTLKEVYFAADRP